MSNFYAKAINPRTQLEEDCTFIDNGKDTFIEFKDGWKYNTKFFNPPVSEQEAINQDGEEIMEQANDITRYERFETFYIIAVTLAILASPLAISYLIVEYFLK